MGLLLLKITITPLLVGAASVAARRWGPGVGGWMLALPWTSGPVAFFVAIDHGASFGAGAAIGSLAGAAAQSAFCVAYSWTSRRAAWTVSLLAGSLCFFAVAAAVQLELNLPVAVVAGVSAVAISGGLFVLRRDPSGERPAHLPRWELPARMAIATVVVLVLTEAATALGSQLSGLLATYPAFIAVLSIFVQREAGHANVVAIQRGLLAGLFGFACFFTVVAASIERLGIGPAFALATATAVGVNVVSLRILRQPHSHALDEAATKAPAPSAAP